MKEKSMLSKQEYEKLKQMIEECNVTYEETDLKQLRKGATGQVHNQFLRSANTKELVLHDVSVIAKQNPGDQFRVEFDGISGFVIFRNDVEIYRSDYYQVERCYQTGYEEFKDEINKVINKDKAPEG
ncbi:MAG: hypothetical protein ACOX6Y_05895 [Christensenellales bacterium]